MYGANHPGDEGNTQLGSGKRVPKDDAHLEVVGCLEELQAILASVLAAPDENSVETDPIVRSVILDLQDLSLVVAGHPSTHSTEGDDPPRPSILPLEAVESLERALSRFQEIAPILTDVLLPGASERESRCAMARATCRRAERRVVTLARTRRLSGSVLRYLNRLGDLLFLLQGIAHGNSEARPLTWRPRDEREPEWPQ